ncbi:MAG: hypothetical protein KF906_05940 [Actinobacteria bacterium]|nr:hypothetical protein [Actinomycetota bacterium]
MAPPNDRELRELTDRTRAEEAASARRRQRSLLAQAGEEGTFAGVLVDLAERRAPVALHTRAGRLLRGTVRSLGADHLGLVGPGGDLTYVPLAAVTGIRPEPGARSTDGDRRDRRTATLHALLVELAIDRPTVAIYTVGGDRVPGRLRAAGRDLATVRGGTGSDCYVALAAINDVALI